MPVVRSSKRHVRIPRSPCGRQEWECAWILGGAETLWGPHLEQNTGLVALHRLEGKSPRSWSNLPFGRPSLRIWCDVRRFWRR